MAYFTLLIGIALLVINFFNWRSVTRSLTRDSAQSPLANRFQKKLIGWLNEWRSYALGNGRWPNCRSGIIALILFLTLLIMNAVWIQFAWAALIPALLIMLLIGQIRHGRSQRYRDFEARFPEALSVINAAVSAGNSIHQALNRCGQDVGGDLGKTFNEIDRRLNLGEETDRVFLDSFQRYPYREFYFFIMVIQVSIQRGGQLRTLITRLARIINNSKKMAKRKKAMTSEARTSAKIVAALPLLFLFGMKYLMPENFNFVIHDPVGQLVLYYVLASEIIGIFIIWMLLKRAT